MTVRFDAAIALRYTALESSTFFLMVQPTQTAQQRIVDEVLEVSGHDELVGTVEPVTANRGLKLVGGPGPITIDYRCTIDLTHHFTEPAALRENRPRRLPRDLLGYLAPSRYCESDRIMTFAREQFGRMEPGYGRVAAIADWVRQNIKFAYGASNWNTSARDTLEQRRGVCRDYAHLMIAILRSLNIPARFVSGFDYGADPASGPPDFHAYVEAFLGDRWYLFDPSGISPNTGLVRIGTGRDAAEVGFATIFGKVQSSLPVISCVPRVDAAAGWSAPTSSALAVSMAANGALLAGDSRLLRQPTYPAALAGLQSLRPQRGRATVSGRSRTWPMTVNS